MAWSERVRPFIIFLVALLATPLLAAAGPAYQTHRLKNGLDLVAMESHKVPLVTIVLCSKAGAMTETQDINGLTHLWEHMFFKGNKRLPDQEAFNKRVRQLGIVFNGDTSAEKVRYFFTLPSVYLEEGLQFMADAIMTPLLEKTELERERHVVLDEWDRNASSPGFDMWRLRRRLVYGDVSHLRDPLGERPIVEKATREQLLRIKDEVFVPSNSSILVGGDFEPARLTALVEKSFSAWQDPPNWRPVKIPPFPPFPAQSEIVMTKDEARNVTMDMVWDGPKARSQAEDSYAADVLISLLNHRSGKFYQKYIDSGLTFQAGLGYHTQSQAGELMLYAVTSAEKYQAVHAALASETAEWLKEDYFGPAQLEDVRRSLEIGHKFEVNKPSDYIKNLAFWWAVAGLDYYKDYLANLAKIDLKDVRAFVAKYLVDKPYIATVLLSPADAGKAGLKDTATPLLAKYFPSTQPSKE